MAKTTRTWLTATEAAIAFGVSVRTIRRLRPLLRARRFGRFVKLHVVDVEREIEISRYRDRNWVQHGIPRAGSLWRRHRPR